MRKIGLEELKKIEINILKDVAKFCRENNIRYYLAYGTLLGAIRHKGFIPWDDDIDIIMPRPDYEKFEKIYQWNNDSNHKLISLNTDKDYLCTFARVYNKNTILFENNVKFKYRGQFGVYMDIFPIDGFPNNKYSLNKHFFIQKLLSNICWRSTIRILFTKKRNLFRDISDLFLNMTVTTCTTIFQWQKIPKIIEANSRKYSFESSAFVGFSSGGYGKKEIMPREIFTEAIEVEFEGDMFKAPKGYHEYLTNIYGDYMTPPPPEKQKSRHNFEAYWRD